ncbi:hypothetical protein OF83DRAFT_222258, partial [Amylostereum chailletii]
PSPPSYIGSALPRSLHKPLSIQNEQEVNEKRRLEGLLCSGNPHQPWRRRNKHVRVVQSVGTGGHGNGILTRTLPTIQSVNEAHVAFHLKAVLQPPLAFLVCYAIALLLLRVLKNGILRTDPCLNTFLWPFTSIPEDTKDRRISRPSGTRPPCSSSPHGEIVPPETSLSSSSRFYLTQSMSFATDVSVTNEKGLYLPLPVTASEGITRGASPAPAPALVTSTPIADRIGNILLCTFLPLLVLVCSAVLLLLAFIYTAHLALFLPALFSLLRAALARVLPWLAHLVWLPTTASALAALLANLRSSAFWTDVWAVLGYLLLALAHVVAWAAGALIGYGIYIYRQERTQS